MAAGGSQGGVQRGGYAELNQRPVMGGGTDGSEGAVAPKKGAGGCSEATGDKMKAWDAMAGPIVTIRLWWLVTDMGSVAARSVRTTPEGLAEPGRCGLPLPSSASQPVEQAGSQMSPGSRHTTRMSEEPGEDSRCPGSQISIKLTGLVGPFRAGQAKPSCLGSLTAQRGRACFLPLHAYKPAHLKLIPPPVSKHNRPQDGHTKCPFSLHASHPTCSVFSELACPPGVSRATVRARVPGIPQSLLLPEHITFPFPSKRNTIILWLRFSHSYPTSCSAANPGHFAFQYPVCGHCSPPPLP